MSAGSVGYWNSNGEFTGEDQNGQYWVNGVAQGTYNPSYSLADAMQAEYARKAAEESLRGILLSDIVGGSVSAADRTGTGPAGDTSYNPTMFSLEQTARNLAASLGGQVSFESVIPQAPGSPYTFPYAWQITFPNGGTVNAGLIQYWVDNNRLDELAKAAGPLFTATPAGTTAGNESVYGQVTKELWDTATQRTQPGTVTPVLSTVPSVVAATQRADPETIASGGVPRLQTNQTPGTAVGTLPAENRGTGAGTVPAGSGAAAAAAANSTTSTAPAARNYAPGDYAPAIMAMADSPSIARSADGWGYLYKAATGIDAPDPESYGLTGSDRGKMLSFVDWYAMLPVSYHSAAGGGAAAAGGAAGGNSQAKGGSGLMWLAIAGAAYLLMRKAA